ncbi:hypothetical protein F5Y07DRAFT_413004 [Xylaria sp. FL0933]|nr:hypothetical protein F5Y07DRAFT_413004 [Xylaria sp. FL0933]
MAVGTGMGGTQRVRDRGKETGKEITEIPLCANCAVACEQDDRDALLQKALRRIDIADGGLSRQRWKSRHKNRNSSPSAVTSITTQQSPLGGDSSITPPPDIIPPIHPASPTASSFSTIAEDAREGETLAKLHYRRSRTPGFAQLECLVPFDAALYVSIFDPIGTPAFRPHPAKPLPRWMSLLPGHRNCQRDNTYHKEEEEERGTCSSPRSVLDVHFPPAAAFAERRDTSRVDTVELSDTIPQAEEPMNERNGSKVEPDMEISPPTHPSVPFASLSAPDSRRTSLSSLPLLQPQHRMSEQRISNESNNSHFTDDLLKSDIEGSSNEGSSCGGSSERSYSPLPLDLEHTERMKGLPPLPHIPPLKLHYKRPSIVADEPLRRPSDGFGRLCSYEHPDTCLKGKVRNDGYRNGDEVREKCRAASTCTASNAVSKRNTNVNADTSATLNMNTPRPVRSHPILRNTGKAKPKTVAWDSTVAGGESLSDESCERTPAPLTPLTTGRIECGEKACRGEECEEHREESPECPECPEYLECEKRPGYAPEHSELIAFPEYPLKCSPSPLAEHVATIWRRVVRDGTPPAQSKEFLDLYRVGRGGLDRGGGVKDDEKGDTQGKGKEEAKEVRVGFAHPSLAVPGRRREMDIGVCPMCGCRPGH